MALQRLPGAPPHLLKPAQMKKRLIPFPKHGRTQVLAGLKDGSPRAEELPHILDYETRHTQYFGRFFLADLKDWDELAVVP